MKKLMLLLYINSVILLTGCSMANGVHQLNTNGSNMVLSPTNYKMIEIFNKNNIPSNKPMIAIGNVAAHGNGYATDETLIETLKKEASKIGAEFVVLSEKTISNDETIGTYGDGIIMTSVIKRPHLYGIAGVYSKVHIGVILKDNIIKYIPSGSPADKAGLKEGFELLAINGIFLQSSNNINKILIDKKPGDVIIVEYLDLDKNKHSTTITIEKI